MKTLYLDCGMGAAGDMLTAALLELLPDPQSFVDKLNQIGIEGVEFRRNQISKCGISAARVDVFVHGLEEDEHMHEHHNEHHHEHHHEHEHDREHDHEHDHEHEHNHEHDHERHHKHDHEHQDPEEHQHHSHLHSSLSEIEKKIEAFNIPEKVKTDVRAVYAIIAQAESQVHGVPINDIHFHEVGTADALADIAAVCELIHEIKPERILCSPIHVGSGSVKCAHGILPVPAPATALILKGIPVYGSEIKGELCTPTGAALLKYFVEEFTEMPVMRIQAIGYGMGKKDFPRLNAVRALLGEEDGSKDKILMLSCNIDDMTGEDLGFAMQQIQEAGAKDVFFVPITMKKSRPAVMLCAICKEEEKDAVLRSVFKNTSTIGVRENRMDRYVLDREQVELETPYGTIRKKISTGYGVIKEKPEYEDLCRAAKEHNVSLQTVKQAFENKKE